MSDSEGLRWDLRSPAMRETHFAFGLSNHLSFTWYSEQHLCRTTNSSVGCSKVTVNSTMDANAVKMDFSFVKNNVIVVENSARQIYVTQLRSRRRLRRRLCSLLRPSRHHRHCPWLYPGLPLRSSEYHFLRHRTKWFPLC